MGVNDQPLFNLFEEACGKYPDRIAIVYLGEKLSYSKMKELIDRFSTALHDLGVKDNDKILLYLHNCPQWLIAYFGALKIGAVPVPISPIYTPTEIEYLINDSGAETIIGQDTNFGYVKEVFPKTCLKRAIVTNYIELLPLYKRVIGMLFDTIPNGTVEKDDHVFFLKDLLRKYPPEPSRITLNPREHLAYVLYTGGTTGFPKGCPTSHSDIVTCIMDMKGVVSGYVSDGQEVLVFPAPLFHGFGQILLMAVALTKGNSVVLMPIPNVDAILDAVQRYKGTLLLGVPTLYRMILEHDRLEIYNLTSLKYCWSGADVLPSEVFNRWKEKVGVPIYQGYGASEIGFAAMSPLDRDPPQGCVGLPIPSREIRIVDVDTLEPVSPGEKGETLIHAETMWGSYWNKAEETSASYLRIDGKIWYRTKDYCRVDIDGQLYFVDRAVDTIKYKGYRVSASEIEAVLQDHPVVIEACVVGVPDDKDGERIKAMVVLKEDARGVGASDLISWCREKLAPYKVPKYIEFRDMLPKSKVGKLLRREIRDEERRKKVKGEKHVKV